MGKVESSRIFRGLLDTYCSISEGCLRANVQSLLPVLSCCCLDRPIGHVLHLDGCMSFLMGWDWLLNILNIVSYFGSWSNSMAISVGLKITTARSSLSWPEVSFGQSTPPAALNLLLGLWGLLDPLHFWEKVKQQWALLGQDSVLFIHLFPAPCRLLRALQILR